MQPTPLLPFLFLFPGSLICLAGISFASAPTPTPQSADLDGSGVIDSSDLVLFQQQWRAFSGPSATPTSTATPTPTSTTTPTPTGTFTPTEMPTPSPSRTATVTATIGAPPDQPELAGCPVLPADNIWNTPIDQLPLDPNSDAYIETIGADDFVHPDFGSGLYNGGPIGIPFIVVDGSQTQVDLTFRYDDESDVGPYPIPDDPPIEGGAESNGDRHVLVLDQDACILYEIYRAFPQLDGTWRADSGAIFDLNSNALRPDTWTSADAAGLPILPGLARYDEVAAGEIKHALRFTAPETRRAYVWPARHFASDLTESHYPPMGQRFRLKADFDLTDFPSEVQVILAALKKYGMILADNGSAWYISGAPDERWDNDVLRSIRQVYGSDFEAVDVSSLMVDPESGQAAARR